MLCFSALWVQVRTIPPVEVRQETAIPSKPRTPARPNAPPPHDQSLTGLASAEGNGRVAVRENLALRLPGGADAPARARRELTRLRTDLDTPVADTLRLLITELVSNAVRHAAAENVSLKVLVARQAVFTEVTDNGPGFDPSDPDASRANHWGLLLVRRLADRWGVVRDGKATKVWFELRRA
jgi:anti-sigma regulatory factor (Ser/Thr protein kinase)